MILLNAALAGGFAAVAAPVIIHIAHRRKFKTVDWGAMRFLLEMLVRSRRRLLIEEWLLLAVRVLAVLAVALALTRPALEPSGGASGAVTRYGRTAAVILIDDSASTGARAGSSGLAAPRMLDTMKSLALAYVDTLDAGDEISVVRLSAIHEPPADPLFDRQAAKALIEAVETTDATSDIPALLETGLARLARHLNPGAEVVLVTDGMSDGWRLEERARWADIRRRLAGDALAKPGTRARPRVVCLSPPAASGEISNAAVSGIRLDRSLLGSGMRASVRVELTERGSPPRGGRSLRLLADGRQVDMRRLDEEGAQGRPARREEVFEISFDEPGSHVIEAVLDGARDSLERDDHRALALEVVRRLPVLLVESDPVRPGATAVTAGPLGFLALALDPQVGRETQPARAGTQTRWARGRASERESLFALTRISVSELASARLEDFRVVVLGDLEALEPEAVAAIERYVAAGGGVLVCLGPRTRAELVNRYWARGGDGFLPCPLGELRESSPGEVPVLAALAHPATSAFAGGAAETWKAALVRRHYRLDLKGPGGDGVETLLALDSGDALLVERRRGLGRAALLATSPDLSWSDLPVQAAFVPLVRGLVSFLGGEVLPPRNLVPGERLTHSLSGPGVRAADIRAELRAGPPGALEERWEALGLAPGTWEGRPCVVSEPLHKAGVCRVTEPPSAEGGRAAASVTWYAVSLHPDESRLARLGHDDRDRALGGIEPVTLSSPEEVRAALDPRGRRPVEMWRELVLAAVALLFVESLLTRAQAVSEGRGGPGGGRRDLEPEHARLVASRSPGPDLPAGAGAAREVVGGPDLRRAESGATAAREAPGAPAARDAEVRT